MNMIGLSKLAYFWKNVAVNCEQAMGCHVRMNKHYIHVKTYPFHLMRSMYFGKKLDFSPCVPAQDEDIQCDNEVLMFRENFNKQSSSGLKSMLKKLTDMFTLCNVPKITIYLNFL